MRVTQSIILSDRARPPCKDSEWPEQCIVAAHGGSSNYNTKGRVPKKNVKVWSLTKPGGGVTQNQTLIAKIKIKKLKLNQNKKNQTYPIHKEIVVSG